MQADFPIFQRKKSYSERSCFQTRTREKIPRFLNEINITLTLKSDNKIQRVRKTWTHFPFEHKCKILNISVDATKKCIKQNIISYLCRFISGVQNQRSNNITITLSHQINRIRYKRMKNHNLEGKRHLIKLIYIHKLTNKYLQIHRNRK